MRPRLAQEKRPSATRSVFHMVAELLRESPGAVKRHGLARARRECSQGSPYSTPVPEEMDFDLFGPSSGSPLLSRLRRQHRCQGVKVRRRVHLFSFRFRRRPLWVRHQLQQLMLQMLNNQNTALQQQQNQMNFLMQAQSAQLTLLNRRLDEEEAKRKAEGSSAHGVSRPFCCSKCRKWFRSNCTGAYRVACGTSECTC